MIQHPLISIIVPTYNVEGMLETTLASICSQVFTNFELILIDGGSSDKTLEIIKTYQKENVIWSSEPDAGLYDAMNKGVKRARGDWLYFLGAGDILVNCLHIVVPHLRSTRTVYYGDVFLPRKNKTYAGEFKWHTLVSKNINHQSIFYPRHVFDQYSYNLNYAIMSDYDLNLRCWGEGRFRFRHIPVLIAVHDESGISNQKIDYRFENDKPILIAQHFGRRLALRTAWLNTGATIRGIWRTLSHQK